MQQRGNSKLWDKLTKQREWDPISSRTVAKTRPAVLNPPTWLPRSPKRMQYSKRKQSNTVELRAIPLKTANKQLKIFAARSDSTIGGLEIWKRGSFTL